VYAVADVAGVKLRLQDFEGARKDLDKSQKILDGFDSVETIVHASFYKVNAEYYQVCLYILTTDDISNIFIFFRQSRNLHHTTRMHSSTWRASPLKISHRKNERRARTT
jgi:hypothetical protein